MYAHPNYKDPQSFFEQRLQQFPDNPTSLKSLAPLKAASSKTLAIKEYRRAVKASPYDPDLWNDLGLQLHKGGKWEAAVIALRKAVEINPRHVKALSNLGAVLANGGEHLEAVELLLRAIELAPADASLHRNIARVYDAMGNSSSAIKHLRIAVRRGDGISGAYSPEDAGAYRHLALLNVGRKETTSWHSHDLYDAHRALTGQSFPLPNSDQTYSILAKTHTKL